MNTVLNVNEVWWSCGFAVITEHKQFKVKKAFENKKNSSSL
jgi:hypothetical protein